MCVRGSFEELQGKVGAGHDGFGVEEGGVLFVRLGVDFVL